jgi:cell division protein FtsN
MSRDYKPSSRQPAKKSGNPMLIGIIIGLFIGVAVSLGVALVVTRGPNPFTERSKPADAQEAKTPGAKTADGAAVALDDGLNKTPNKPRFDFYNILPGKEEPVTDQEFKQAAQRPSADKDKSTVKESYYLQVGSFPAETDADNLKAKLALIGIEAGIQTTNIPDKGVWHRVRVGPFTNVDDLNRIRNTLTQNNVQTTLVKIKDN